MSPRPRMYKGKFAKQVYARSEVRFATQADLDQVKNYAKVHGYKSFNSFIVSVLLQITDPAVGVNFSPAQRKRRLAAGREKLARRAAALPKSGRRP